MLSPDDIVSFTESSDFFDEGQYGVVSGSFRETETSEPSYTVRVVATGEEVEVEKYMITPAEYHVYADTHEPIIEGDKALYMSEYKGLGFYHDVIITKIGPKRVKVSILAADEDLELWRWVVPHYLIIPATVGRQGAAEYNGKFALSSCYTNDWPKKPTLDSSSL